MVTSIGVRQAVHGVRWLHTALLLIAVSWLGACDQNLKPSPLAEPEALYWDLELNQHAVTLATTAPYDTLTLTAVPRNHRGEVLAGLPAPTYTSTDIEHVLVTPEGQLVAVAAMGGAELVKVVASLTVKNLTHRDSVWVRVVGHTDPPVLASFSVHPIPPDSAKLAATYPDAGFMCDTLPLRAADTDGNAMDGLPVSLRFSDSTVARSAPFAYSPQSGVFVTSGADCHVFGLRPGNVTIYATMTAFGVTKADTLPYRVGWPLFHVVNLVPAGSGSMVIQPEVRIGTGGLIVFLSNLDGTTEITFADPTNVAGSDALTYDILFPHEDLPLYCAALPIDCNNGNIVFPPSAAGGEDWAIRVFPVPSTYDYTTSGGVRAKIIVLAD